MDMGPSYSYHSGEFHFAFTSEGWRMLKDFIQGADESASPSMDEITRFLKSPQGNGTLIALGGLTRCHWVFPKYATEWRGSLYMPMEPKETYILSISLQVAAEATVPRKPIDILEEIRAYMKRNPSWEMKGNTYLQLVLLLGIKTEDITKNIWRLNPILKMKEEAWVTFVSICHSSPAVIAWEKFKNLCTAGASSAVIENVLSYCQAHPAMADFSMLANGLIASQGVNQKVEMFMKGLADAGYKLESEEAKAVVEYFKDLIAKGGWMLKDIDPFLKVFQTAINVKAPPVGGYLTSLACLNGMKPQLMEKLDGKQKEVSVGDSSSFSLFFLRDGVWKFGLDGQTSRTSKPATLNGFFFYLTDKNCC